MPLQPRKAIAGLKTCAHGGVNYAELTALGVNPDNLLDFSVSTNPFMPPPEIKEIMATAPIERYPDSQSTLLRGKLAGKLGIDINNILAGNGTTELIRLITMAYFRTGNTALIIEPTYGEYETACRLAGARLLHYRAAEKSGFTPDIKYITGIIQKKRPHAVFMCNPNNPTGLYLTRNDIEKVLEAAKDSLLILDEAYVPFVEKRWDALSLIGHGNIILLRSMTKDYGIPGLRLGYAAADRDIIDVLRAVMPPWNVNAVAQQAGTYLLENDEYLEESLRKTREVAKFLKRELAKLGFAVLPSDTHYFLVKVANAAAFRRALLAKGIMVRDCSSFGLPQYIRISPRSLPDCRQLVAAFKDIKTNDSAVWEMEADRI